MKTRVSVYCRVSTEGNDQANSFASQKRFFEEYIKQRPEWELYKIYADEGLSGTSTKNRRQFIQMIQDGYCGKFNLILTKEVSRFSRNILDTISFTRQLKNKGIGVLFLTDGIFTLDPDAELRLSIMGTLAQEESRRISQRVKWGQTRQMEKGIVFGRSMLGYDVKDGVMIVNPQGAEIVRKIFYLYGVKHIGSTGIAKQLEREGVKTFSGKTSWTGNQILKILKNEKYAGDLIQKKTYTPDYLTHSKKYNHGTEPKIRIPNHHEPIVSKQMWNIVQEEIKGRNKQNFQSTHRTEKYLLSGKILCGKCGSHFVCRRKKNGAEKNYVFWRCSKAVRFGTEKETGCDIGHTLGNETALNLLCTVWQLLPIAYDQIASDTMHLFRDIPTDEQTGYDYKTSIYEILNCNPPSNRYLTELVSSITVTPEGTVEIVLAGLPFCWVFTPC